LYDICAHYDDVLIVSELKFCRAVECPTAYRYGS